MKNCENCKHYRALYRKGTICFWIEFENLCEVRGENTHCSAVCENFEKQLNPPLTLHMLDKAYADVEYLLEVLKNE